MYSATFSQNLADRLRSNGGRSPFDCLAIGPSISSNPAYVDISGRPFDRFQCQSANQYSLVGALAGTVGTTRINWQGKMSRLPKAGQLASQSSSASTGSAADAMQMSLSRPFEPQPGSPPPLAYVFPHYHANQSSQFPALICPTSLGPTSMAAYQPGGSSPNIPASSRGISSSATQMAKRRSRSSIRTPTATAEALLTQENHQRSALNLLARVATHVQPAPSGMHNIAAEIEAYALFSSPTSEVLAARLRIIRSINRAVNQSRLTQQPKPFKVVAFGSTTFGLDSSESDLDLCILDPHLPRGPRKPSELRTSGVYSMYTLAQILRTLSFTHILPIQTANVPIVKFRSPDQLIAGDINTNHALGVYNSALLCAYRDVAPGLFRPLGMAIKLWAKARGLCDPSGATGPPSPSAYTLILMLVSYLQEVGQLPNLQDERAIAEIGRRSSFFTFPVKRCHRKTRKQKQAGAEEHDTSFAPRPVEAWAPKQEAVLEELFAGFFAYYARFNFAGLVISIRNGGPCERRKAAGTSSSSEYSSDSEEGENLQGSLEAKTKKKKKKKKNRRRLGTPIPPGAPDYYGWEEPMAVEDPFIRSRNTCKNIGRLTVRKMKSELLRAQEIIEAGGGLLELCGVGQVDGPDLDSNSGFTSLATPINTPNNKVVKQVRVAGASDGSQTQLITESYAKKKKAGSVSKSKKEKQPKPKAESSQPKLTNLKKVKSKLNQSNLSDTLEFKRKFHKKKTEEFWQEFRARGKAKVKGREKAILEFRTEPLNEVENTVVVSS